MLDITAANTRNLQAAPAPAKAKGYPKRYNAQRAAIATLGPEAREGFEFDTTKLDGLWYWRATDEVRPPTAQQIKANGGKRAMAAKATAADPIKVALDAIDDLKAAVQFPRMAETDTGVPAFLARPALTETERDALIAKHKRTTGPTRKLKNPPTVKAAKAKAGKRGAAGGGTKAAMVGQMLLDPKGCTTADILKATGWPSVSVPAQAKAVGLGLRKEKVAGQPTRYFGVPTK